MTSKLLLLLQCIVITDPSLLYGPMNLLFFVARSPLVDSDIVLVGLLFYICSTFILSLPMMLLLCDLFVEYSRLPVLIFFQLVFCFLMLQSLHLFYVQYINWLPFLPCILFECGILIPLPELETGLTRSHTKITSNFFSSLSFPFFLPI